jgi:hypothetical protein
LRSALIAWLKGRRNIWSDRDIARVIEQKHPSLDSLLLTAIEHEPDADEAAGFLHERLIDHALARAATQNWPGHRRGQALHPRPRRRVDRRGRLPRH